MGCGASAPAVGAVEAPGKLPSAATSAGASSSWTPTRAPAQASGSTTAPPAVSTASPTATMTVVVSAPAAVPLRGAALPLSQSASRRVERLMTSLQRHLLSLTALASDDDVIIGHRDQARDLVLRALDATESCAADPIALQAAVQLLLQDCQELLLELPLGPRTPSARSDVTAGSGSSPVVQAHDDGVDVTAGSPRRQVPSPSTGSSEALAGEAAAKAVAGRLPTRRTSPDAPAATLSARLHAAVTHLGDTVQSLQGSLTRYMADSRTELWSTTSGHETPVSTGSEHDATPKATATATPSLGTLNGTPASLATSGTGDAAGTGVAPASALSRLQPAGAGAGAAVPSPTPAVRAPSASVAPGVGVASPSSAPASASTSSAIAFLESLEFVKVIAAGGAGRVYLVRSRPTGVTYAVKMMAKGELRDKNMAARVMQERDIMTDLAGLQAPYFVRLYCAFRTPAYLALVMEFVPGGDLYSLLHGVVTLEDHTARIYAAQLVMALDSLHRRGIAHRDLKPDNLLIDRRGCLKLADFGLSHAGLTRRVEASAAKRGSSWFKSSRASSSSSHAEGGAGSLAARAEAVRGRAAAITSHAAVGAAAGASGETSSIGETSSAGRGGPLTPHGSDSSSAGQLSVGLAPAPDSATGEPTATGAGAAVPPRRLHPAAPPPPPAAPTAAAINALRGGRYGGGGASATWESREVTRSGADVSTSRLDPRDPQGVWISPVGTANYTAPEVVLGVPHATAVDWWALGCIIFEFHAGYPPFIVADGNVDAIYQNIVDRRIAWPAGDGMPEDAVDIINRLLTFQPNKRLGYGGADEVKRHRYFSGVDWDHLYDHDTVYVPTPIDELDTSYFEPPPLPEGISPEAAEVLDAEDIAAMQAQLTLAIDAKKRAEATAAAVATGASSVGGSDSLTGSGGDERERVGFGPRGGDGGAGAGAGSTVRGVPMGGRGGASAAFVLGTRLGRPTHGSPGGGGVGSTSTTIGASTHLGVSADFSFMGSDM